MACAIRILLPRHIINAFILSYLIVINEQTDCHSECVLPHTGKCFIDTQQF